ncbi:unnamed protein product, partial [marine sediment metagenome]
AFDQHFEDGRYALRFDPTPLPPDALEVAVHPMWTRPTPTIHRTLPAAPRSDEAFIELGTPNRQELAAVALTVRDAGGQVVSGATCLFQVLLPKEPPDPTALGLLPAPKEITLAEGRFPIGAQTKLHVFPGEVYREHAINLLTDELQAWFGAAPRVERQPEGKSAANEIVLGEPPPLSDDLTGRLGKLPAESYVLVVTEQGVRIAADGPRGLVNGVCTLLQAIESHYAQTFELAAPAMQVVDWPDLPIRAVSIPLPTNRWGHPNDA